MTSFVAAVEDARREQLIADLRAAQRELIARGRCREQFVDGEKVCAMGAVAVVVIPEFESWGLREQEDAFDRDPRIDRARQALRSHLTLPVMVFNDDESTTDQDVLDLFDKTLADLGGLAE